MLSKIYVPCVVLCKLPMAQYRILFLFKEENMCCCFRGHGSLGGSHGNNREDWGVWNDRGSVRSRVSIGSNWFEWRYFNFAHVVMIYSLSSDISYMTTWMAHLRSICKALPCLSTGLSSHMEQFYSWTDSQEISCLGFLLILLANSDFGYSWTKKMLYIMT